MASGYTEDHQVEQPAIDLFNHLGWRTVNAYDEVLASTESKGTLGRETRDEVVLTATLKSKLEEFNPDIPQENLVEIVKEFTKDRSSMHPVRVNKEIYDLIREGVDIEFRGADGMLKQETVKVIDWKEPDKNDFQLVSQLWVNGDYGNKRPDLVGFVNGLPLLLFELKKPARPVQEALNGNISDYKDTIPKIFWYNQFIFLSNGVDTKIGTISSPWEFYTEWKKISDEEEPGIVSLETAIRGVCEKNRLLDLLEHFILFENVVSKPKKLMARNHQYLGVNNAIQAVKSIEENKGKLGVFWHTQGSGKSYSMALLTRKIMRSIPGDWKFVIVTDRLDLDEQIYKNFAGVGAVTEPESEVRADSKEQLKQLLQENHRYTFTLIHKFHSRDGEEFPVLSEDDDIIVITDEAHRTQYDTLAMNMRKALPNASFLGFTGTPLIKGEDEKTREVFGDYVSIYDFKQSIEDNATVPLFYENRIPELELSNEHLNEELQQLLEDAMLNEAQEEKLAREFRQEYHLITRKDRLETIAKDVVQHFLNRGFMGKGMMVCIDRFTTVRMYDLVQKEWEAEKERVKEKLKTADKLEQDQLLERLKFLQETDMAVVISKSQNEIKEFDDVGLDIRPHRIRLEKEPLDEKFKDDEDPLRFVFVCAMWITGFSVSSLSTLYLDKPMKSHTLMQTIARANRVFEGKNNGMIVDYVGVFRHLQDALAVYATGPDSDDSTVPVKNKEELIQQLREAIKLAKEYCERQGVGLQKIIDAEGFEKSKYQDEFAKAIVEYNELDEEVNNAADKVLINEEKKKEFVAHARTVNQLYKAILPDPKAGEFLPIRSALKAISDLIKRLGPTPNDDLTSLYVKIEEKLDESIHSKSYVIDSGSDAIDLSNVDFEKLKDRFAKTKNKRVALQKIKVQIEDKLEKMIEQNHTRIDFKEQFEEMIEKYNNYSVTAEVQLEELFKFVKKLNHEEERHIRENLSEEQLTLFDVITQHEKVELTKKERESVKMGIKELLDKLKKEKLVLDWTNYQSRISDVRVTIEKELDSFLPDKYDRALYAQTCSEVFDHVLNRY
ncbi:type I restriction endonuclease subunit R [Rhodohalobacter sp. 614A]|uniref:type I restriction endonuclease subunit R n=1 Tax=Rhodohalobacter sp. 614A TaxID=2908649 RepID=UPI001F20FA1D|nr:type I restriction endonuclease subunit R [Rhodohalobacter sp. 614A]